MISTAAQREELARVLSSELLRSADTLRRLLAYLGEASITGKAGELKEYTVGLEALGKPSSYDPQLDSSVRVQASKLRTRLEEYYRGEGERNPIRIEFPKGHFELKFRVQAPPEAHDSRPLRFWQGLSAVLGAVALLASWYALSARKPRDSPISSAWTPEMEAVWGPLAAGDTPILLSFETGLFLEVEGWAIRRSDINDPADVDRSPELGALLAKLGNPKPRIDYPYVGFGGVNGVFLLSNLLRMRQRQIVLKRSVVLTWEDIRDNHIIFVGIGKTQAKIRDMLARGDFAWDGLSIKNRKPRPGEQPEYRETLLRSGERVEQYGLISMLHGPQQGKRIVVLGGGSAEGEWAAAEYMAAPDHVQELVSKLRSGGQMPSAFQAVIRMTFRGGVPIAMSYVTHHVVQ